MNEKSIITLVDKTNLKITGVNKINGFDSKHFNLDTALGDLQIFGSNLEMVSLDNQNKELLVSGTINQIAYQVVPKKKENFLKKMFK